jgi:hypothetical protein
MTFDPDDDFRNSDDVPLDPDGRLWWLRIPQSGCALLEDWEVAVFIVSNMPRWISHPVLTHDESGCPELQLIVCRSERRAIFRCISIIQGETSIPVLKGVEVSKWEAESRGFASRDEAAHRDRGGA